MFAMAEVGSFNRYPMLSRHPMIQKLKAIVKIEDHPVIPRKRKIVYHIPRARAASVKVTVVRRFPWFEDVQF